MWSVLALGLVLLTGAIGGVTAGTAAAAPIAGAAQDGRITTGNLHTCAIKTDGTPACWGSNAWGQTAIPAGTGTVTQIAAGQFHTCAVKTDGTPTCWGRNEAGQSSVPAGTGTVIQISAGLYHTCAVKTDGTPTCWGRNDEGQGTIPAGTGTVTQISTGTFFTCAVKTDGTPTCWGMNDVGQTGIPAGTGTVTQISAGAFHACAVKANGTPTCWGLDDLGQRTIPNGIGTVTQISTGNYRTCAIKTDGIPTCWGYGTSGQSTGPAGTGAVTQISAGLYHTCAVKTNGTPTCWGGNDEGQSAVPTSLGTVALPQISAGGQGSCAIKASGLPGCWGSLGVPAGTPALTQIAAGARFACAIQVGGTARCWGSNEAGATDIPTGLGLIRQIAAGPFHGCAIQADGTPVCWGSNFGGQLNIPIGIGAVTKIAAGQYNTCAIKADGTPICWGQNSEGQNTIPTGIGAVTEIAVGYQHVCAVQADGAPVCWGDTASGGTAIPAGIGPVTQIGAGSSRSCALQADGTPVCWGDHSAVPAGTGTVTKLSTGSDHTCAVQVAGAIVCWGYDGYQQLGGTPTITSPDPGATIGPGAYTHTFTAGPAARPTARFFVSAGSLPPGLTLDGATGGLSGAPITSGDYTATVTATNDLFGPNDTQTFTLHVDVTPPAVPGGLATTPASPSRSLTPLVTGTAEANSTVDLYDNATCTGTPLASGSAAALGDPGLTITVPADTTTTVHATATDDLGNVSACSTSTVTYVNDRTAPVAPSDLATTPAPRGRSLTPLATGTAEAGSTVDLYDNATCTGTPLASGSAAGYADPGLTITVPADATTTVHATATDAAGNTSACSTSSVTYVNDRTPPAVPGGLATTPGSPSRSLTPLVTGIAEAGSTVDLYDNATCTGTPLASGSASDLASPGLTITVPADTTTTVHATAADDLGNVSACSTSTVTYVNDRTAPLAPSDLATTPASPSASTDPHVKGTAEAGATVTLYANATCTGTPLASGDASRFAAPGLAITVAADATTTVHANATDAAGNISPCSSRLTYRNEQPRPQPQPEPVVPPAPRAPEPRPEPAPAAKVTALTSNATCIGTGRRARKDITVRYRTNQAATTTFTLQRRTAPKTATYTRCPGPQPVGDGGEQPIYVTATSTRAATRAARTRAARPLVLTRTQTAGAHTLRLLRDLQATRLAPGRYRLRVAPVSTTGVPGPVATLYLWVLAPPKAR